jgi:hypothetical protein
MPVYSLPGSPLHFLQDFHQIWCSLAVRFIMKSHQARYVTPRKDVKKSANPPSSMKLYTLTPRMCWYYQLQFQFQKLRIAV